LRLTPFSSRREEGVAEASRSKRDERAKEARRGTTWARTERKRGMTLQYAAGLVRSVGELGIDPRSEIGDDSGKGIGRSLLFGQELGESYM
jgi:hypothetical protein